MEFTLQELRALRVALRNLHVGVPIAMGDWEVFMSALSSVESAIRLKEPWVAGPGEILPNKKASGE